MTDIREAFTELGQSIKYGHKIVNKKLEANGFSTVSFSHFFSIVSGKAPDTVGNFTVMNFAVDWLTEITYARDIFLGKIKKPILEEAEEENDTEEE